MSSGERAAYFSSLFCALHRPHRPAWTVQMAYHNYVFTIFAGFSTVLVSIPFYWHLEAWNTATCMYMFWTAVANLNFFINSIIWNGRADNIAPVWCDISSRIILAVSVGVPASSLAIARRLYRIVSVQSVTITKADKRREMFIDFAICLGVPIAQLALSPIVNGNRFQIFGDVGCYHAIQNCYPAYPLVEAWPLALGIIAACYSMAILLFFIRRRRNVSSVISNHSHVNVSRYYRLMALTFNELLFTIPLNMYLVIQNAKTAEPWHSWAWVHMNYDYIFTYPALQWRWHRATEIQVEMARWPYVFCAFLFFVFFGFADEARRHYATALSSVAKKLGVSTLSSRSGAGSGAGVTHAGFARARRGPMYSAGQVSEIATLPVFLTEDTVSEKDGKRRGSLDGKDDDSIFGGRPLGAHTALSTTMDGALSATSSGTYDSPRTPAAEFRPEGLEHVAESGVAPGRLSGTLGPREGAPTVLVTQPDADAGSVAADDEKKVDPADMA